MPYATAQEFEQLVGEDAYLRAADRDGDGQADSTAVTQALESASSIVDSYATRWLPLPDPAPTAIRHATIRIAHYNLTGETGNEEARKRYEDAIQWLRDVAKGVAKLDLDSTPTSAGAPDFNSGGNVMNRSDLGGAM